MNVLVVCGARSLLQCPGAEQAVAELLEPLLQTTPLVVTGDAAGPDTWAKQLALTAMLPWEQWCTTGLVLRSYTEFKRWSPSRAPSPLDRNAAMVRQVYERHALFGDRVVCVGFTDPMSKTHGTDHTLRFARLHGIWTARFSWQRDHFEEMS